MKFEKTKRVKNSVSKGKEKQYKNRRHSNNTRGGVLEINNRGVGVIEIILILLVLIALVLIFRKQIEALVIRIFGKINSAEDSFVITPIPTFLLRFGLFR